MNRNAITILVDSVIWDCIGTTRCKVSPSPFLDSLKKESVTATKLYSHGPYTDAATRSLYTGRRCLDDFSYFFKLNTSPTHHFKVFHDNGYETYGLYYPYYMVGKEMRKSIDHTYYTAGFIFGSEWGGCFYYYAEIIKRRKLNQEETALLKKRLEMMLDTWIDFYNDAIKRPETISIIASLVNKTEVKDGLIFLLKEKEKFEADKETYIYDFLHKGKNHKLATLNKIDVDTSIDRKFLDKEIFRRYNAFFSYAKRINFKANFWHNRPSLKRIISCFKNFAKTKDKSALMILANYFLCVNAIENIKRQSQGHWQDIPSAKTQFDFVENILKNRNSDTPFYMSLHFLEPHNAVSFFSFDSQDQKVHDEEFDMLDKYCHELGSNFRGNLAYLLSIRYVDYYIEKFCNVLKQLGLWENTILTIMSDHGSSYSFYPLHGVHVNCFDEECYHVPVLIRVPNGKGIEITDYHNSLDVMPTLYDLMGFAKPIGVIGDSMINSTIKPKCYVITEYMGPGCPDLLSRPIWFSIRDSHYTVGYKVGIYQSFEEGEISEVFDLYKDPNGYFNRVKSISRSELEYLLVHLKKRFEEVKADSYAFIERMMNTNVSQVNNHSSSN